MPKLAGCSSLELWSSAPNTIKVGFVAGSTAIEYMPSKPTPSCACAGSVPGPVVRAKLGDEVIVLFRNDLDEPTTIRWHGIRVPDGMDGPPRASVWPEVAAPAERQVDREESITFSAIQGERGVEWQLNGKTRPMDPRFTFHPGESVRLQLKNMAGPEHPFHLHG